MTALNPFLYVIDYLRFKIAFELSGSNNDNLSPGLVVKFLFDKN